jgi:hypothetical protein
MYTSAADTKYSIDTTTNKQTLTTVDCRDA